MPRLRLLAHHVTGVTAGFYEVAPALVHARQHSLTATIGVQGSTHFAR
jgi:hypothetical protein